MERVTILLEKIKQLNEKEEVGLLDLDLMMDYTRVLYSDLMEWRNTVGFNSNISAETPETNQPTPAPEVTKQEPLPRATAPSVELSASPSEYKIKEAQPIRFESKGPREEDIRKLIGINDKYQFISELFGNNKEAYEAVIDELNTFEAETEALNWLKKSVFLEYHWDEQSLSVQSFYQVIGQYFADR